MKLKKVSFLAFSLLLGLSALHAVPTGPTNSNPSNPTNSGAELAPVTLFSTDSKQPVTISVSQGLTVILPMISANAYSFCDSSLFGANTIPYTFDFTGSAIDPNTGDALTTVTADCANLGKEDGDAVVYQRGAMACTYMHFDDDGTATPSDSEDYYIPVISNEFSFIGNTPGTTTLTFSDGRHTYSYPITVVAAPAN